MQPKVKLIKVEKKVTVALFINGGKRLAYPDIPVMSFQPSRVG
jgi:hypothetical protein